MTRRREDTINEICFVIVCACIVAFYSKALGAW